MSAMKDRVAALCEQLGVEHSGSGLAPAVRLCAAAAGMTYETIAKTVEALELEVFGVAPVSVVAPPAEGTKRKRAEPPAAAVKREPSAAAAATPAAPAARKRPCDEDDDFELTKVQSPAERAAESMEKAKKDGVVQDIDEDGEPARLPLQHRTCGHLPRELRSSLSLQVARGQVVFPVRDIGVQGELPRVRLLRQEVALLPEGLRLRRHALGSCSFVV